MTGEFDLVDVEVDDLGMIAPDISDVSVNKGGGLAQTDGLIQVLLKAKHNLDTGRSSITLLKTLLLGDQIATRMKLILRDAIIGTRTD